MKNFIPFMLILLVSSCGTIKEIPVQTITKEIIRDTTIYHTDTITIEVPKEVIKEALPALDTSTLETSLAVSTAFLDTLQRTIHHELKNKDQPIKKEIEYKEKIIYKDKIIEKEVPVEVKVDVPFIPRWCWILLTFNALYFGLKIGRFFINRKRLI